MQEISRIKTSFWLSRDAQRLVRMIAGATEETQGEVLDRLIAQEADRLGITLTRAEGEPVLTV